MVALVVALVVTLVVALMMDIPKEINLLGTSGLLTKLLQVELSLSLVY